MVSIDNESTLKAALKREYNLFVGAGFSVNAEGRRGQLPLGQELAQIVATEFGFEASSLPLSMLCDMATAQDPERFKILMKEIFKVTDYDKRYEFLTTLVPRAIMTTNVDNLFNRVFEESRSHYIQDVIINGANTTTSRAVPLLQIHGSVLDDERPMIFGRFDLGSAPIRQPIPQFELRDFLMQRPTIIWGNAIEDPSTLTALRDPRAPGKTMPDTWVQVYPGSNSEQLCQYWRTMGFHCIEASTDELLDYLAEVSKESDIRVGSSSSISNIPTPETVHEQPIEKFFLGAAPTFGHVYRNVIVRTGHYSTIVETLRSGKNVIVSGIPACGKTTLLIQVAISLHHQGECVIFEERLDAEKAALHARRIGKKAAYVVIDNLTNDIRTLDKLRACENVTFLCADRDIALSSVMNRLKEHSFEIIDVTGQSGQDLRRIWESIPPRIKRSKMQTPLVSRGTSPSLYEFVIKNIQNNSLSSTIANEVNELDRENSPLAELVVLACYLNYGHSVLSSDVAMGYFKSYDFGYSQITEMIESVGQLLCEEYHDRGDMDYFGARSRIVAEEVMQKISGDLLRDVITTLFQNVSTSRIDSYRYFKRFAYDARLIGRAFREVNEGVEFYDGLLERYDDPHIAQQKALYLVDFSLYQDAFRVIDNARSVLQRKRWTNFTIENTFYKVLFLMNLDLGELSQVRINECLEALQGIQRCFESDTKKAQHAMLYSECVLKFIDRGGPSEETKVDLLLGARRMLDSVQRSGNYIHNIPVLLRRVSDKLRDYGNIDVERRI